MSVGSGEYIYYKDILDHGYLKYIDHCGSDEGIIEAARMSTDKGFEGWQKDEALLEFLYAHFHHTPFEMPDLTIEVKAPIMVYREWHRHRTQSYNEMSARYIPLPDENYVPTVDRCLSTSLTNKQAGVVKGAEAATEDTVKDWLTDLENVYSHAERVYQNGLKKGIPKEIARLPVPVARYSKMRAKANLRNWLGFMTLRCAPSAQWEIRQYANAVYELIKGIYPRTAALFTEYQVNGVHFGGKEMEIIKRIIYESTITRDQLYPLAAAMLNVDLKSRKVTEFLDKLYGTK